MGFEFRINAELHTALHKGPALLLAIEWDSRQDGSPGRRTGGPE